MMRLEVFKRDDATCLSCGAKDKTLHAHHLEYAKSGNPWDVPTEKIETLCVECHEQRTSFNNVMTGVPTGVALPMMQTMFECAKITAEGCGDERLRVFPRITSLLRSWKNSTRGIFQE